MAGRIIVSDEDLKRDIDAYMKAGGNRSEAARLRKLPRNTYRDRLVMAQQRLGIQLGKVVDGRVDVVAPSSWPLPPKGKRSFYLFSSAQNNTHPHPAHAGMIAYRDWLAKQPFTAATRYTLGSFSYAIDAYGAKSVKRGTYEKHAADKLWYHPELVPFINDDSIQVAPGLVWCGEQNILPTAADPLRGLEDYNGRNSNIVPHVKQNLTSVASLADEATKLNYSTGTVTMRNYIQKRVGILAERKHVYGGLIVEVDSDGNWYVRQLEIDDQGAIYDLGPDGYSGVKIQGGKVDAIKTAKTNTRTFLEAITWGDIHSAEMDVEVRDLAWGAGGVLDTFRPRKQFWHDIYSMRSRGHHEMKDFHRTMAKHYSGEGIVEDEVDVCADWVHMAVRDWCESIVVRSNHDRHLDRWVNEADPKKDPPNALYWVRLQNAFLGAMATGEEFNLLEYALRSAKNPIPESVYFCGEDESYVICKDRRGGIECGLHGDLGPNGARGSTRSLKKLGRPVNKCHDHTATKDGDTMSAGACSLNFPYMKGPNAHSVSHIFTFENAARQIVTFWNGKCRA